jgi:hypothetical protein
VERLFLLLSSRINLCVRFMALLDNTKCHK